MDVAEIEEMFGALGVVSVRRMFGGKGVYHHGLILAVEIGGEMLLKADAVSAPAFEAAGARRWCYAREGKSAVQMPYWSIPEAALDDPEQMAHWVRLVYAAAVRAAAEKSAK